jgi:hypothetical protein
MKTFVSLEDTQAARLTAFFRRQRISRSEAVRRTVDLLVPQLPNSSDGFGLWKTSSVAPVCAQTPGGMDIRAVIDSDVLIDFLRTQKQTNPATATDQLLHTMIYFELESAPQPAAKPFVKWVGECASQLPSRRTASQRTWLSL